MAMTMVNASTAQANVELAAGEAGVILRVERLILTSWVGLYVVLLSDPGGPNQQEISSRMRVTNGSVGVFDFSGRFALNSEPGKALGFTSVFQGAPGDYGLMIWYEKLK